ncbi:MAG TPA: ATP-binding cassette domain-containing protein [Thermoanaerobaculia bacterium]|nr:ATP-binding cassette domain-containing protein [Thermoanaerobaculia bacterium]
MNVIHVRDLSKRFRVPVREGRTGFFSRLRRFVVNPSEELTAVHELSFDVDAGEVVGFLGANGSGKSTTIKMLTGILTPSSGVVEVLGYVPYKQRIAYTHHIGLVLGQKTLLWWNIPVIDSLRLYRDIYGQSPKDFEQRLDHFADVLEIRDILHLPVRKLSLGLRMRAEIVASLLHRPRIIFLDEPTIGLDVLARLNLKRFLRRLNEDEGVTIFLTTHNLFDVEELCRRCLILERGHLIYNGDIAALKAGEKQKIVEIEVLEVLNARRLHAALERCDVLQRTASSYRLQVAADEAVEIIGELFEACRLSNMNVIPPTLESIVEKLFEDRRSQSHVA